MICARAAWPTTVFSALWNQTTDGRMLLRSVTGTIRSLPSPSNQAAEVLVVPKSMPRIGFALSIRPKTLPLLAHPPEAELPADERLQDHRGLRSGGEELAPGSCGGP
jgi:hypothetical protein